MELLPAIDLRHGHVVRLLKGDDRRRTVYDEVPERVLAAYAAAGVERVHVVDLDAALGEEPQWAVVERLIAAADGVALQLGGGLRDREAVERALTAGCGRVVLGSLVTRDFQLFAVLAQELPGRLVPALDVAGGKVKVGGWTEEAEGDPDGWAESLKGLPCPALLVTDIERDGTLEGPNLPLTRRVAERAGLPALISGGVRSLDDLAAARRVPAIAGAVVGKALYERAFTLTEALAVCRGAGEGEG